MLSSNSLIWTRILIYPKRLEKKPYRAIQRKNVKQDEQEHSSTSTDECTQNLIRQALFLRMMYLSDYPYTWELTRESDTWQPLFSATTPQTTHWSYSKS